MLGARPGTPQIFKNPFGGPMDGVEDSQFTARFGYALAGLLGVNIKEKGAKKYTAYKVYPNPS